MLVAKTDADADATPEELALEDICSKLEVATWVLVAKSDDDSITEEVAEITEDMESLIRLAELAELETDVAMIKFDEDAVAL